MTAVGAAAARCRRIYRSDRRHMFASADNPAGCLLAFRTKIREPGEAARVGGGRRRWLEGSKGVVRPAIPGKSKAAYGSVISTGLNHLAASRDLTAARRPASVSRHAGRRADGAGRRGDSLRLALTRTGVVLLRSPITEGRLPNAIPCRSSEWMEWRGAARARSRTPGTAGTTARPTPSGVLTSSQPASLLQPPLLAAAPRASLSRWRLCAGL